MKVLLTGASGFIGRSVLDALVASGITTVVVGRQPIVRQPGVDFLQADLLAVSDFTPMLHTAGASHLLHLAWYAEHGKYWTSPLNLRWVDATTRLVEAFCATGGRHVTIAGTCAEYDSSHGLCTEDSTPLEPATLYGVAKDAARRLAAAVCRQQQVPLAWGRIFLPYGGNEVAARLIPSLIDVFRGNRPAFGINAGASRDFLHIDDVASAFLTLLHREADGAYNISSGVPVRLSRIVETLAQRLGGDAGSVLRLATSRPGEPEVLVGDNTKLRQLGWQPGISLDHGLRLLTGEPVKEFA